MSLTYSGAEPQPSLAWTFENSNVDSVTSLQPSAQVSPGPAQLQGSAALVTNAPSGSNTAVSFDGSSGYMNLGTATAANFNHSTSNLFVEAWVYTTNNGVNNPFYMHLSPLVNGNDDYTFTGPNGNGKFNVFFKFSTTSINLNTANTVPINTWTHLAVSFVPGTLTANVFYNGFMDGSAAGVGTIQYNNTKPTIIGNAYNSYFNGYIRDLRVVQGGVVPVATFTPGAAPFSYALPSYVTGGTTVFTLLGQFITYVPGKYANAIYINNQNTVTPSSRSWLVYSPMSTYGLTVNNFSISSWIYPYTVNTSVTNTFFNMRPSAAFYTQFRLSTSGSKVGVSTFTNGSSYQLSSIGNLSTGQWSHHCVTYSNVGVTTVGNVFASYYINGVIQATRNIPQVAAGNTPLQFSILNYLEVGSSNPSVTGMAADASLDDLRIYNSALTSTQVQSVYSSQGAPAPSRAMPLPKLAWDFNGTTTDYVSGLAPSIVWGNPTSYGTGKYLQDAVFTTTPGSATSGLRYDVSGQGLSSFTIAFWVKPLSTIPVASGNQRFLHFIDANSTNFFWMGFQATVTTPTIYGQNPSGGSPLQTIGFSVTPPAMTQGQWLHLTWTVAQNGQYSVYINGVSYAVNPTSLYASQGVSGNPFSLANPLKFIDVATQGGGQAAFCEIDDLRIFDRALTSAQVQAIYNQQGVPGRGALVPQYIKSATGGDTVQDIGGYRIHTFTTVGTSTFTPATAGNVEVLVVGGGGGGGGNDGGGGSGGQVQYFSSTGITGAVSVTVGSGGGSSSTGGASSFGAATSIGGGGGGNGFSGTAGNSSAYGGGSGGSNTVNGTVPGPTGTVSYKGGDGFSSTSFGQHAGGGGGGAGGSGVNASVNRGGNGGPGLYYSISGQNKGYGGGGGGGVYISLAGITNGKGTEGGGDGGYYLSSQVQGTDGTPNTGGGGGAGADGGSQGRVGGSGIVIVRYPLPIRLTGTPLFTQLSQAATSSAVGAFSLRAVNGTSARAVQVRPQGQFPPVAMTSAAVQATNQFTQTLTGYPFGGAGSYTANCSSYYTPTNLYPWYAFDKTTNTWASNLPADYTNGVATTNTQTSGLYNGAWLQIQLPVSVNVFSYTITSSGNFPTKAPAKWYILGSNDGSSWTLVDSQQTGVTWTSSYQVQTFTPTPTVAYSYYRMVTNQLSGSTAGSVLVEITELIIYGAPPNTATDFYADRLGNLLTAPVTGQPLANWLGGATGYVTTWYDQSGKGNHATQSTAASQPIIQRATKGPGYMCVFSGAQGLTGMSYTVLNGTNYSVVINERRTTNASENYYIGSGNGATNNWLILGYRNNINLTHAQFNNDYDMSVPFYAGASEPIRYTSYTFSSTNGKFTYNNGSLFGSRTDANGKTGLSSTSGNFTIGSGYKYYTGEIYELLVFTQSLYDLDTSGGLITQVYQNQLSAYGT